MAKATQDTHLQRLAETLQDQIKLNEGEKIVAYTRRHWVALAPQIIWPLSLTIIGALTFFYRAQGGTLVAHWPPLSINPQLARVQWLDQINLAILAVTILIAAYIVYLYFEWIDDYLILTSERVIVWHRVLLGKHSQSQIKIDDIQNVSATTRTYLEHWLNFGTVTITSAAFGGKIIFDRAYAPRDIQKKIMEVLNAYRREQSVRSYHTMIEKQIYENKELKKTPMPRPTVTKAPPPLNVIFPDNPEVDEASDTITWHKHWIYTPLMLMKPVGFLLVGMIIILAVNQMGITNLLWSIGSLLVVLLIFLGWAAWEIEDEMNESYILTPTSVIDVDKKPFGPENRNTAGLGSIQNVTYKTTLISRILGYGDVIIDTAGGGQRITFDRVPNPANVASIIAQYQSIYRKGEKERALNDTITLLKHYHLAELNRRKAEEERRRVEEARDREVLLTSLLIPQSQPGGNGTTENRPST